MSVRFGWMVSCCGFVFVSFISTVRVGMIVLMVVVICVSWMVLFVVRMV